MNEFVACLMTNAVIDCVYAICVTYAATFFNKPAILWWFVLLPFLGTTIKSTQKKEKNDE